jgi:hypothetical protein
MPLLVTRVEPSAVVATARGPAAAAAVDEGADVGVAAAAPVAVPGLVLPPELQAVSSRPAAAAAAAREAMRVRDMFIARLLL